MDKSMVSDQQRQEDLTTINDAVRDAIRSGVSVNLSGDFNLPKMTPIDGERYFGIWCERCGIRSPAFPDPSNGQVKHPFDGAICIIIQCRFSSEKDFHELQAGVDDVVSRPWP